MVFCRSDRSFRERIRVRRAGAVLPVQGGGAVGVDKVDEIDNADEVGLPGAASSIFVGIVGMVDGDAVFHVGAAVT